MKTPDELRKEFWEEDISLRGGNLQSILRDKRCNRKTRFLISGKKTRRN